RHKKIHQQEHARQHHRAGYNLHVSCFHQRTRHSNYVLGHVLWGWHELQESVQAKNQKNQAEKNPRGGWKKPGEGFALRIVSSGIVFHIFLSLVLDQPPAIAPMIMNGSSPLTTDPGNSVSGGSSDISSLQAKKRINGRRFSVP